MKHKFLNRRANYICYMLIISILIGFFSNNLMTIYGDETEVSGEIVGTQSTTSETTQSETTSEDGTTTSANSETTSSDDSTSTSGTTTED